MTQDFEVCQAGELARIRAQLGAPPERITTMTDFTVISESTRQEISAALELAIVESRKLRAQRDALAEALNECITASTATCNSKGIDAMRRRLDAINETALVVLATIEAGKGPQ